MKKSHLVKGVFVLLLPETCALLGVKLTDLRSKLRGWPRANIDNDLVWAEWLFYEFLVCHTLVLPVSVRYSKNEIQ